jgi:hypothetical protein
MTTVLDEPADLLKSVGQRLGTTDWMKVTLLAKRHLNNRTARNLPSELLARATNPT